MLQIITQITKLEDRPALFGAFGAVFGYVASTASSSSSFSLVLTFFSTLPAPSAVQSFFRNRSFDWRSVYRPRLVALVLVRRAFAALHSKTG